jgi:uncharacterized damage-inducible protein DinB
LVGDGPYQVMSETGREFIKRSRYHLSEDFLPKIERCVALLSDEQLWWRPNEESNSIGNLLLHLSGNARQWIVSGLGAASDARDRDSEFARREIIARDDLLAVLRQTLSDVDQALAGFDADNLLERKNIQGCDVTALAAILHVVEHFSMHTGQIILMTKIVIGRQLGFYDSEQLRRLNQPVAVD